MDHPALTTEKALFSCPACGGALTADREAYRCPGCVRIYPIVFGIPDFRLAPDPYISFVEEYEKARVLAEEAERRSFEELVRFYWQMTPGVPPEAVARYTRYALDGERRARVYLNAVDAHLGRTWIGDSCLDIGCGTGGFLLGAGDRFHELVGVDIALRWLIVARKRLEGRAENIVLVCCSAEHLPFPGGKFDAAVGLDVLEHAEDAPAVLSEAARTLRSGGLCYLATPNRFSIGPEPCVRLWGVGFLPRGLARLYVQQIRGVPYRQIRLLSFFDLRRLLRRSGLRHWRIAPAPVPLDASAGLSRVAQGLLRFYNALRGHPILARVLLIVGPYLQVVARPR